MLPSDTVARKDIPMKPDIEEFQERFPAFRDIPDGELRILLDALETANVAAGTELVSPRQPNDALALIWSGRLRVLLEAGSQSFVLGYHEAGNWVGEMGLVEPAPAIAEVTAVEDSVVLRLPRAHFLALRREHPALTSRVLQIINRRLTQRLRDTVAPVEEHREQASEEKDRWFEELGRRITGVK
jgi:CRP-like cAMP-binding protein